MTETDNQIKNQMNQLFSRINIHTREYNDLYNATRSIRYFWCHKPELEPMEPTFTYVASQLEKELMKEAGEISRLYNEHKILEARLNSRRLSK